MRIRSLEISGFKSFADRVVLAFDEGISAIVGPNGCGKSNVVDAIRWVMGEQNPRHLRGRLMDDIIFAGSEGRAPVGMAEVVLTLDTSDGSAPGEYSGFPEIQVARRLYRSGESEYLINRVPCRLRDVSEFFLDTGIGTRGYTIVEQGQIASIVSTRPEDRRFIIEEAAGIGKYRQRRLESERKLEGTEQNLLRVTDVLGELRRQISSLDRQARKAARYKELSAQLRELELVAASVELRGQSARLAEASRQLEEVRTEATALDARVARAESLLEAERRQHLDSEKDLQSRSERLYALRAEIQSLEDRIEFERRVREGLLRLAAQRDIEVAQLDEQIGEHRRSLTGVVEELTFTEERLGREEGEVEQRSGALQEQSEALAALQGRREAASAHLAGLVTEAATLESRAEARDERRREIEVRLRDQEEALEGSSQQADGLRDEEAALEARLRAALEDREGQGRQLAEGLRSQETRTAQLEAQREALAALRERGGALATRLEDLREAEERQATRVRELLERLPDVERRAVRGLLSDAVRVEEGLERALETALAGRLDAVLVDDARGALALLSWLRGEGSGRATVLAVGADDGPPVSGFVPLGRPLLGAVTVKPPFEPVVRRLLSDVYVVDDLAEAVERFGTSSPPATFITPAGELLDRSGALTGGGRAAPGSLQRASEIRRLEAELLQLESARTELESAVARERTHMEMLGREVENRRSRHHTADLAVVNFDKDLDRARERSKEALESGEEHRAAKSQLVSELERIDVERAQGELRAAAVVRERAQAEAEREQLIARVNERSREIERVEQRLVQQKVELAELGARRDQLRATRDRLQDSIDANQEWLQRRRHEVRGARENAEALARSSEEASERLAEQIRQEEQVRSGQAALRSTYEESARRVEQAEAEARVAGREREGLRERLSAAELGVQEARMRREQLVERIRERYGIDLERFEPPPPDPVSDSGADPAARQAEVERLRRSLDLLGDVHLGAIEEYEEVSERHRYLTEQKADLELSVERLRNAIARINRTSRQRFRETFDAVNEEFQRVFPSLFRGGRAHLSLTDADDVLEAGIEITAQPPGKKLQNVNLLSGGEKSLTAIALLFAVFQIKPSPFFLLDEVDAALDDANVSRFNELVKAMSATSQFLVITHNKGTIEVGDRLFGVTMQEPGLSKLVTVDLVN
jgi:chromosome segregation protein